MLKVVSINLANVGSTGKIVKGISSVANEEGITFYNCYPYEPRNLPPIDGDILICNKLERKPCRKLSIITGLDGVFGKLHTHRFIHRLNKIKPDIIHIHNLHFGYIHIPSLIKYVNKKNIKVVWTFHDCWAFTGRCPYFTLLNCEKWKTGCGYCPYPKSNYPYAKVDRTMKMWNLKKRWFTSIKNMTIVTPSKWLADLVKQSFLKQFPIKVIENGIDLATFKPIVSDFRQQHNILDKFIVLGVAFDWGIRKGLDVFVELSKTLGPKYQIVLVGTNDEIDKELPLNIISIHRTKDQRELAEIYTAADVFFNPTREENYPTVNMETIACGTPVITFNTGGSPEIISKKTGIVIKSNNLEKSVIAIKNCCENRVFKEEDCLKHAKSFDMNERFKKYVELYKELSE